MNKNKWIDVMDDMPPYDTKVEAKGHYYKNGKEIIQIAYFSSDMGDWMWIRGDPSHWRFVEENNS